MNIFDVVSYGPIVFASEEFDVLITINGAYLNWWRKSPPGWENIDCRSGHPDLYTLSVSEAMDLAEGWFNEVTDPRHHDSDDEELDDEDDSTE